jgi:predicted esterase
VLTELERDFAPRGAPVFAGFSQGVAMAYRAAALPGRRAAGVIALAADIPPELTGDALAGLPPILIGRGSADPWYDERRMDGDVRRLREAGVTVSTCVFDGAHEWTAEFAQACGAFFSTMEIGATGFPEP